MYGLRYFGFMVMAAVVFVLGFSASSEAAVYKWKDDQGKTHFTDSLGKVPPQYRDQIKSKGWPEESRPAAPKPAGELKGKEESATDQSDSDAKKIAPPSGAEKSPEELAAELEKQKQKLEAELKATEAAMAFFEVEIPRYNDYYERSPGRGAYRNLRTLMGQVAEEKKALSEKLQGIEAQACKAVLANFDVSLPKDEKFASSRGGHMKKFKTEVIRLKSELPAKKALLSQLQGDKSRLEAELEKVKADR